MRPHPSRSSGARPRPSLEVHLWLGLLTGAALVVVSVTGIVLNHEPRLDLGNDRPPRPQGAGSLAGVRPINDLLKAALREAVRREIKLVAPSGQVRSPTGPSAIDRAVFRPATRTAQVRLLDPLRTEIVLDWSTAAVLGYAPRHDAWIEQLHSGELLGPRGVIVSDIVAVALVVVVVTALVLWLRRTGPRAREAAVGGVSGWMVAQEWLHRIAGLIVAAFAIVLCVTGVVLNHRREWGLLVEPVRMLDAEFVARLTPLELGAIVRSAVEAVQGRAPGATADDVKFIDYRPLAGYAEVRFEQAETEVILDAYDRKILSIAPRRDRWIEDIHARLGLGSRGHLLSDLAGVLLILLTVNGIYLWVKPAWDERGKPSIPAADETQADRMVWVQAHVSGLLFVGAALFFHMAWRIAPRASWNLRDVPGAAAAVMSFLAGAGPWLWRQTVRGQRRLIMAALTLSGGDLLVMLPVVDFRAVFGCQMALTAAVLAEVGGRRKGLAWFWAGTVFLAAAAVLFALLVEPRPVPD